MRRAAPGETLACIGGAYAVAPGRALAVAMGCYRLGVLAGIRRSRLAALAYGGLLYYPTPRQSLSHKGAAFIYTRSRWSLLPGYCGPGTGSVSRSLSFFYRALLAKVGDTAPGQESVLPYGTSALLALTSATLPEGVPVLVLSLDFGVATADADAHPLCPGLRVCCW